MNILLTGATGFLGSNIYRLLSSDHQVSTLSRKNADYNYNLELELPILDKQFDLVIHCAGKAHSIPTNDFEIASFYKTNIDGIVNILHSLSNSDTPKYFVFISSVSVYGLIQGESINEKAPLLAKDAYGKSKIEAEKIVINWCNEHNVIYTILRLPLVVGDNPPGNLGSIIKGIKKGYYCNIAGGGAKKSMVLASDIASFILKAAEKGGTYNLTDGHHPSFNILSKHIAILMGKTFVPNLPKFIAIILAKIGDLLGNKSPINSVKLTKITSTLTFDDSKARATFGWDPSPVVQGFKLNNNV
jgi:nucleoside-diphosphate-sugar epimerase